MVRCWPVSTVGTRCEQKGDDFMKKGKGGESLIYVTAPDRETALDLARGLLERRLIACANVFDGVTSLYWWQGQLEETPEAVMIAKTTSDKAPEVIDAIRDVHPYDCPCIVALPITAGNPDFLNWIAAETGFRSE
jgi:periplasmic divalent cation tolerance protein